MPKIFLLALFISLFIGTTAQNSINYEDVPLETDADYKAAENMVLEAADYVLSKPIEAEDAKRFRAIQLIMAWMEGTPDYVFDLSSMEKLGTDINNTTTYLASLAKYAIENPDLAEDTEKLELGSWRIFLNYCEKPENKIKKTRSLNKLINANRNGRLGEALE